MEEKKKKPVTNDDVTRASMKALAHIIMEHGEVEKNEDNDEVHFYEFSPADITGKYNFHYSYNEEEQVIRISVIDKTNKEVKK